MAEVEIKRHKDGTRYVQPYLGRSSVTGKPIRPYKSFPATMTDAEVDEAARRWLDAVGAAAQLGASCRVGDLLDLYIDSMEREGAPVNTVAAYRSWRRSYVGTLADKAPGDVEAWMLERLYQDLLTRDERAGGPLSQRTVRSFSWFLSGAFRWMVSMGIVATNPCSEVRLSTPAQSPAFAFDEQVDRPVLVAMLRGEMSADAQTVAQAHRRCAAFLAWLALNTGVRCGEACALRREDVRYMMLRICGTVTEVGGLRRQDHTKDRGERNVSISPEVAADIRAFLGWQDGWLEGRDVDITRGMPLATINGRHLRPTAVARQFHAMAMDYGLPPESRFHTLRHTHATWLLLAGGDMRTVSERLGHKDVATTMRYYGHVLPGRDAELARMFSGAVQQ